MTTKNATKTATNLTVRNGKTVTVITGGLAIQHVLDIIKDMYFPGGNPEKKAMAMYSKTVGADADGYITIWSDDQGTMYKCAQRREGFGDFKPCFYTKKQGETAWRQIGHITVPEALSELRAWRIGKEMAERDLALTSEDVREIARIEAERRGLHPFGVQALISNIRLRCAA